MCSGAARAHKLHDSGGEPRQRAAGAWGWDTYAGCWVHTMVHKLLKQAAASTCSPPALLLQRARSSIMFARRCARASRRTQSTTTCSAWAG